MDSFNEINNCKNVFTDSISEPADNRLRVVLNIGISKEKKVDISVESSTIKGVTPIVKGDVFYEVLFNHYACYYVLNESYFGRYKGFNEEVWEGGPHLRQTKNSRMINFFEASGNDRDFVGDYTHYQISTWTHVIDVISVDAPIVKSFYKNVLE